MVKITDKIFLENFEKYETEVMESCKSNNYLRAKSKKKKKLVRLLSSLIFPKFLHKFSRGKYVQNTMFT